MNRLEIFVAYVRFAGVLAQAIWSRILIPALYTIAMWAALVVAAFLVLKDFWQSAGAVSAITLFYIIRAEFNKEFLGDRNGIQEQAQRE